MEVVVLWTLAVIGGGTVTGALLYLGFVAGRALSK